MKLVLILCLYIAYICMGEPRLKSPHRNHDTTDEIKAASHETADQKARLKKLNGLSRLRQQRCKAEFKECESDKECCTGSCKPGLSVEDDPGCMGCPKACCPVGIDSAGCVRLTHCAWYGYDKSEHSL